VNCRKVSNLLSAYMDGELPGVEQLQIRDHLGCCPCCSDEYESLLTTKRMLARLCMKQPGPELEDRILLSLSDEPFAGARSSAASDWWSLLAYGQKLRLSAFLATGALAVLFVVVTLTPGPQPQSGSFRAVAPGYSTASVRTPGPAVRDVIFIHNPTESSPAAGSGASIMPVSLSDLSGGGAR
jgi:hypothetical protein